ncbi:hypothetical protein AgCh_007023 [Apium graveolens]
MYNVATSFLEFTISPFLTCFLKISGEEKQLALSRNEISNKMAVSGMKSVSHGSGSDSGSVIGMNNKAVTKIKQMEHQQEPEQQQQHSFDEFFSSKRSVPHDSDPLHNR